MKPRGSRASGTHFSRRPEETHIRLRSVFESLRGTQGEPTLVLTVGSPWVPLGEPTLVLTSSLS